MQVIFDRRAMIALRSLEPAERSSVESVQRQLSTANPGNLLRHAGVVALQRLRGDQYYSIRAGSGLRLLGKVVADVLIVEDILARERLEQISGISLP